MRTWSFGKAALLAVLLAFVLFFVVLSVDAMARIWAWRLKFESPVQAVLLLYLEGVHALVTLLGVVTAALAAARARRDGALVWLALGVGFAALAYTQWVGFGMFAGSFQSSMAMWLRARGVSQSILAVLFAMPQWAAWLALPPLLRFLAEYPRPLRGEDVLRSGAADRTGAMRSVALAGMDVGRAARSVAAGALARGWLTGNAPWIAASLLAVAHTAALRALDDDLVVNVLAALLAALPVAALIALARAAYQVADSAERRPLVWLRRGAAAGLVLFTVAGLASAFLPHLPIGAILLSAAPGAMALCCLVSVLRWSRSAGVAPRSDLQPAAPTP